MCYSGSPHYSAEVLIPREVHAKYFPALQMCSLGSVRPHTLVGGGNTCPNIETSLSALCELRSKQCKLGFSAAPSEDEHPNPIDLNLDLFVRTEHPFSTPRSYSPGYNLQH